MKRTSLILLMQLIAISLFAQFSIKGTVTDIDGNMLPGANVIIENSFSGTSTDNNGAFILKNLKPGMVHLEISFIGYEKYTKKVSLVKNVELEIQLKRNTLITDEVIIQATAADESMPVSYTQLNKKQIRENNIGEDIPFLLSLTPGLVESSETGIGMGYTSFRLRGTDASRINVTVNGIPLNDAESHGVFWVNMPDFSNSVDHIQIQRGVGTSSNGAAAFGGSINLQTTKLNKKPYAELSSSFGSFNTFKNSISFGTGLINDKFSVDARYSDLDAGSYIQHGFSDHKSLFVSTSYYGKNSLLKANIIHGDQRTGITWWGVPADMLDSIRNYNPAGVYTDADGNEKYYEGQTDNYKQTHYQLLYSLELGNHLSLNTAAHYTGGNGYYEQYKDDESFEDYMMQPFMVVNQDTITETDLVRQKWIDNSFYGASANIDYRKNKLHATFGGAWNQYDGDHFGNITWMEINNGTANNYEWYRNNGLKTEYSVFSKFNYSLLNNLSAFVDLQYRNINYQMSGVDDDFKQLEQENDYSFFNPKVGVNYKINDRQSAFLSYSIANREPTRANIKEAIGDPEAAPKPERLSDYEFGYKLRSPKAAIGLNLYYMDYKDQLVLTGEKSDVGYDIMTNVPESYRMGVEVMSGWKIIDQLVWEASVSLSKNRIKNFVEYSTYYGTDWSEHFLGKEHGETNISYSPEFVGTSKISFTPVKDLKVSFISKRVGKQYFDNTSSEDRMLDAYFVNHLYFSYSLKNVLFKQIDFHFQIKNIFN